MNEAGGVRTVARLDDVPVGLGWLSDGRLLVVSQHERRVLRQEADGHLVVHADLSVDATSDLNDMCVDHTGCAYVGEVGFDPGSFARRPGRLHLVHADGSHIRLPEPIAFPNGMSISPNRDSLYVNASLEPSVRRFDIDRRGHLSGNSIVAALDSPPDGMSDADAEGGHWIATPETNAAIRVETDRKCLAVALGGSSGTTLFLCTTITDDPTEALLRRRSRIETVTVRVPAA